MQKPETERSLLDERQRFGRTSSMAFKLVLRNKNYSLWLLRGEEASPG